ncbi:DUF7544 domain-containing protein [Kitasatospora sp. NPDC004531]
MSTDGGGSGQRPGGQWGQGQPYGQGHWPGAGGPGGWGQGPWGAAPVAPKPGVIPLRPMSFGEMFGAVFDTIRRCFTALYLPLLAVTGVGAVPVVLVSLLGVGGVRDALDRLPKDGEDPTGEQLWDVMSPMLLLFLVVGLVLFVQYLIAAPLSTVVLRAATLGRRITARQAWKETLPRLWPAVLSQAAVFVPLMLLYVVALVVPFVLGVLFDNPLPMLLLLVLFPVVAIGAFFVMIRLILQVPVVVLEESTPVGAIRRAWRLNEGNWWRSLLLTTVVALTGRLAANIVAAPFMMVLSGMMPAVFFGNLDQQETATVPSTGALTVVLALGMLFMLVFTMVTAPLTPLANGVMYIDRRIRNERLDIALAEAAGIPLTDPAAPPAAYAGQAPAQPSAQPSAPAPRAPEEPPAVPADAPSDRPAPSTKDDSGTS